MTSMSQAGDYLIGHDIGGTKCAVILGRTNGEDVDLLRRIQFPTAGEGGPEAVMERLEAETRTMLSDAGLETADLKAIGISCGGPLDSRRGLILSPPNLPGWDAVPIVERFTGRFGVPVGLQNDANACALAEWRWGAGRGVRNMIFLTMGTGMGAGLILDGRLYSGTNDLGGEVGHVRLMEDGPVGFGKAGSFEGFCSGGGIARQAQKAAEECLRRGEPCAFCGSLADLESVTAQSVAEAAEQGDRLALHIYEEVGRALGRGLAMLIDILNPERIVIGSIFARRTEMLWPSARQVIEAEAIPMAAEVCRVVPAALGERIGDYASLSLAALALAGRK